MVEELQARFDCSAEAYDHYISSPLGKLRDELAWHWLAQALLAHPPALDVVDVGCGPGILALRLAEAGHRVCLLDPSPTMLTLAKARASVLPPAVQARLSYHQVDLISFVTAGTNASFDLALGHFVVEYLPNPGATLSLLAGLLRPGGLLSLVFANQHAEPLRRAVHKRKSEDVCAALVADVFPEELFGLQRRMLTPAWVREELQQMGMTVIAERGIRVFSDYILDGKDSENRLAAAYDLELAAADLFPWKYVGRYVHTLSRK